MLDLSANLLAYFLPMAHYVTFCAVKRPKVVCKTDVIL